MNKNQFWVLTVLFGLSFVSAIYLVFTREAPAAVTGNSAVEGALSSIAGLSEDTVAVLNILDTIEYTSSGSLFYSDGSMDWVPLLDSVIDDGNIKAVVIRLDTPGGTVGATQEIYNAVKRLRENGIIVVASVGDLCASGGYYVASAADLIVANPGSLVGSIGVVMSSLEFSGLMEEYGVTANVITSGEFKDIMSSYRPMTDEEREALTEMVDDVYEQFFAAVFESRNMSESDLRDLADGSVFSGNQAYQNGLVDELGDFEYAVDRAAEMAGIVGEPAVYNLEYAASDYLLSYFGGNFAKLFNIKSDPVSEALSESLDSGVESDSPVMYLYSF